MKKLNIAREVVAMSTAFGASMIVGSYANVVIPKVGIFNRVIGSVGKYGIESVVGNLVYERTKKDFDMIVDSIKEIVNS